MPGITLTQPWVLLILLPLAAGFFWLARTSLTGLPPRRARNSLGIRLLLVAVWALALAGPAISFPTRALRVLFLLDRSASIPPDAQARQLALVNDATKRLPANAQAGVLVFGQEAMLEREPGPAVPLRQIHSRIGVDGSDLAAALRLGQAVLPEDAQRRLVVLSDGNETVGAAAEEARAAAAAGVQVDVIPIEHPYPREVLLDKVVVPERAKRGEPLEVRVTARATAPLAARVRLLRDGVPAGERNVPLRVGLNAVVFPVTVAQPGYHTWEAVLEAPGDTLPDNNRGLGFTYVQGEPRVLLVEGSAGEAAPLAAVLRDRSLRVERVGVGGVPTTLSDLRNYDTVLLDNVRADQISPGQMRLLQSGVRDLGLGLLMIGGADSLTAGGWRGTPVEEALPVRMDVKRRKEEPEMALLLVIDHSGSMTGSLGQDEKLTYAKQAALGVTTTLRPDDELGVIAFDDLPDAVVSLGKLSNGARAEAGISSIGPGGGTSIYPALEGAFHALSASRAGVKHVLLLTDGQSYGGDYDGIARRMRRERITMSTVGVGSDADGQLLSRLASMGGGRYYPAARAQALPLIFEREARLASRRALVEEAFRPQPGPNSELLRGLPAAPLLLGYVATTLKDAPGVEQTLLSQRGEPVVAAWRYGLGRAVAVTTDAKARWAAPWLADGGGYFARFWPQVVRSTLRATGEDGLSPMVTLAGGEGHVVVDALTTEGEPRNGLTLAGRVAGPGDGQSLRLEQTGPGRYEGRFEAPERGQYLVSLVQPAAAGKPERLTVAGAAVPYSPEFRNLETATSLLLSLAELTGGQAWPALGTGLHEQMLSGFFRPSKKAHTAPHELWPYFLLFGALLLPLDVGLRRLVASREELAGAAAVLLAPLTSRLPGRRARAGVGDETTGRLLAAKAKSRAQHSTAEPSAASEPPASVELRPISNQPARPPVTPRSSPTAVPPPPPSSPATDPDDGTNTRRLLAAKRRANRDEGER
jgi:Mg-chelatase subunit ChlD